MKKASMLCFKNLKSLKKQTKNNMRGNTISI